MNSVVGIFAERGHAEIALNHLKVSGFAPKDLILLTPEQADQTLETPSEDAEQPGMGKAIGGVAGGAAGLAAGAAISNFVLPGIGPILALGISAGALGVGGALAGGAAGDFFETAMTHGLPKDEIFLYEDALRQGRTVIIAFAQDDDRIERGRAIMERDGAESLDAARKNWWIGLRDAEQAEYQRESGSFEEAEDTYRHGFEAALQPGCRGRAFDEAHSVLKDRYGSLCDQEAFRRGYRRGQRYHAEVFRRGKAGDSSSPR